MLSTYVPILGLFALAAGFAVFSVAVAPLVPPVLLFAVADDVESAAAGG